MHDITLQECAYLGGCNYPLSPSISATLTFGTNALTILPPDDLAFSVPYFEFASLDISGPGSTTTGGGFVGGGFGVEGAVEGMAIASVLNALTTRTKIHTFLSLTTNIGELHFHYGRMEPSALRIALSPVFTTLRRLSPSWRQDRLAALQFALSQGAISDVDFKLIGERLATGRFPGIVNENEPNAISELPQSLATHLEMARTKRRLGFNRPQIADYLSSVGLQTPEVNQLLQALYPAA